MAGTPTGHEVRASYKPDIAVGIAWGLRRDKTRRENDFYESWLDNFEEKNTSAAFVDLFYSGQLVERWLYVSVDDDVVLPVPTKEYDDPKSLHANVTGYSITEWENDFFRLLNRMEGRLEFDRHIQRAGFKIEG